jgi:hypothetical protein
MSFDETRPSLFRCRQNDFATKAWPKEAHKPREERG